MRFNLERRISALEEEKIYRISSLADLVVYIARRQRGEPIPEDVEWDSNFKELWESCWKRSHESDGS